jgi:hypothetical protein
MKGAFPVNPKYLVGILETPQWGVSTFLPAIISQLRCSVHVCASSPCAYAHGYKNTGATRLFAKHKVLQIILSLTHLIPSHPLVYYPLVHLFTTPLVYLFTRLLVYYSLIYSFQTLPCDLPV